MNTTLWGLTVMACLAAVPPAPAAAQSPAPSPASSPAGSPSPSLPSGVVSTGQIEIVSIEPAKGTVLKAGANVTLKARVRFRYTGKGGQINMVVQDQSRKPLLQKLPSVRLDRTEGEAELRAELTIPKTGVSSVDVFIPMFSTEPGVRGTNTATYTRYTVAP